MKILLDECVDWRLAREIVGHDVSTVHQLGWSGIVNGELLRRAEKEFDVLLTVDRNLSFQQSVLEFDIAVIVMHAPTNRLQDLTVLVPKLLESLPRVKARSVTSVRA